MKTTTKKIKVELTKDEADFLSGLVEGQKARIELLGKRQRELRAIKKDEAIASKLEQKLVAFSM